VKKATEEAGVQACKAETLLKTVTRMKEAEERAERADELRDLLLLRRTLLRLARTCLAARYSVFLKKKKGVFAFNFKKKLPVQRTSLAARYSGFLLYWYKRTITDAGGAAPGKRGGSTRQRARSARARCCASCCTPCVQLRGCQVLALLVQKYLLTSAKVLAYQ
jgi:hypothetical protein